jgi:type I restriction enzyme M protein
VPLAAVLKYDASGALLSANLDLKNPHSGDALEHLAPEALVAGIMDKERRILAVMSEIQTILAEPA